MRFCLCIFESDTVKSDCPVQIFRKIITFSKIYYRLLVYLLLVLLFLEILKKSENIKKKYKSSENDQLTGHFQSFFYFYFRPLDPKSERNSRKSTNKKNQALYTIDFPVLYHDSRGTVVVK